MAVKMLTGVPIGKSKTEFTSFVKFIERMKVIAKSSIATNI